MADEKEAADSTESGKKKKKMMIIIAGALVVLLGGGAGAFFFLNSSSKNSEQKHDETAGENPKEGEHDKKDAESEAHGDAKGEKEHGSDQKDEKSDAHGKDTKKDEKGGHDAAPENKDAKDSGGGGHGGSGAKPAAGKDGEKEAPLSTSGQLNIDFGQTYAFKAFNVNLGNPMENRYVRLEISIEYKGGSDQQREIEARLAQLRDAVISVTSKKTREFLLGPDGKDQLRLEILNRINQYMDKKIESVYVTDMLIE
jgi:flagellar FliL protein